MIILFIVSFLCFIDCLFKVIDCIFSADKPELIDIEFKSHGLKDYIKDWFQVMDCQNNLSLWQEVVCVGRSFRSKVAAGILHFLEFENRIWCTG